MGNPQRYLARPSTHTPLEGYPVDDFEIILPDTPSNVVDYVDLTGAEWESDYYSDPTPPDWEMEL